MEINMKKLLLLIILLAFSLSACGGNAESAQPLEISTDQAYELYQNGTFLLDVRTQAEWDDAHAPNTTLIPLDELPNRLNELPKEELIVVICRSGNRSATARDLLLDAGFTQVTSMSGGLTEWASKGYPITSN
jgi:rhodanese-related sulfurtransferase